MEIVDDAVVGTEVRRCTVDEPDLQTFHTNQVKTTVTCILYPHYTAGSLLKFCRF